MDLIETLAKHKISITPQFNTGMLRGTGKQASQWFVGREFTVDGLIVQLAWFGDWKDKDEEQLWRSHDDKVLTPGQRKAVGDEIETRLAQLALETQERHEKIALEAQELWDKSSEQGEHPYITRKKLAGLHGTRIHLQERGFPVILIPMRDTAGKLWNVTRIYTKKFEGTNSDKFVLKGGRKQGVFYILGEIRDESTVYITEGFATGCSVFEATGRSPTVVSFDAGNIFEVAKALREKFPLTKLVFAADNDQWTKNKNNQPYNTGREAALKAASATRGSVVLPRFTDKQLETKPTDWNDLHCLVNLQEVSEQLTNPAKQVQEVVPLYPVGKGKNAKITEKMVCAALFDYFGDKVLKYEQDLFIYRDNYWQHMTFAEWDKLKQLVGKLAFEYGITDIERAIRYFVAHVPSPPKGTSMFQPTPFAANFENGTLHIWRSGQGYKTEFRPHSKDDFLTSKLPFSFPGVPGTDTYRSEHNAEFDAMLARVWEGDEDMGEKVRLYKQILGACLIPLFPVIVLAVGKPGTGKSTLLKLMRRLVSEENISTVDPSNFHGFLMEGMVGKLLNINTDIDLSTPMKDSMVKAIIDRLPIQVNRKNLRVVSAFIPAVHAFAGNGLPKTLDGESRAYERRMVIIKTDKFQPTGNYDKEFDQFVWDSGPGGIVCAAVEGLFDLLNSNGHYHKLESGIKLVKEMQTRNDPVGMFMEDSRDGHIRDKASTLIINPNGRIESKVLWSLFKSWKEEEERNARDMGRTTFYRVLEDRGYPSRPVKGTFFIKGLELVETDGSGF